MGSDSQRREILVFEGFFVCFSLSLFFLTLWQGLRQAISLQFFLVGVRYISSLSYTLRCLSGEFPFASPTLGKPERFVFLLPARKTHQGSANLPKNNPSLTLFPSLNHMLLLLFCLLVFFARLSICFKRL